MFRKFFYILPLSLVAGLGVVINASYYISSFANHGYNNYSIPLSVFFMGSEVVLWLYSGKKWFIDILKIALVVYSMSITLGVQFLSTSIEDTTIRKTITNTSYLSDELEDYRKQIDNLNVQINEYISQQRIFGSEKNREDRERAEKVRDELQLKLNNVRDTIKNEESIIEKPMTDFEWYASVFKTKPESIRFIFQLFASVLLAIMAPITLTMIRTHKLEIVPEIEQPELKSDPIIEKSPWEKMELIDKKWILKMILWKTETGQLNSPEFSESEFKRMSNDKNNIKAYSLDDIKTVWDEIYKRGLAHKSNSEIEKELFI